MDNIKNVVTGGVITLLLGGTLYTFNQQDVINNFADDTGLPQEQAELYVNSVTDEDLATFTVIGTDYIDGSKETLAMANDIDCITYEYEWESSTLTCNMGVSQLKTIANSELMLGKSYVKMDSDDAVESDILTSIRYIDQLNSDYDLEISRAIFDTLSMDDIKKNNSYNKSLLKAAVESE
jgi:hypothetical protein